MAVDDGTTTAVDATDATDAGTTDVGNSDTTVDVGTTAADAPGAGADATTTDATEADTTAVDTTATTGEEAAAAAMAEGATDEDTAAADAAATAEDELKEWNGEVDTLPDLPGWAELTPAAQNSIVAGLTTKMKGMQALMTRKTQEAAEEKRAAEALNKSTQADIATWEKAMAGGKDPHEHYKGEIKTLKSTKTKLETQLEAANATLAENQEKITALESAGVDVTALQDQLAAAQTIVRQHEAQALDAKIMESDKRLALFVKTEGEGDDAVVSMPAYEYLIDLFLLKDLPFEDALAFTVAKFSAELEAVDPDKPKPKAAKVPDDVAAMSFGSGGGHNDPWGGVAPLEESDDMHTMLDKKRAAQGDPLAKR